jgi:hypothetical protein
LQTVPTSEICGWWTSTGALGASSLAMPFPSQHSLWALRKARQTPSGSAVNR